MQRYEAYKDSGIEWIGEIPAGWDSRNLGACSLLIQTGPFGSQLHQSDYGKGGNVAVINPTDIVDGAIEIDRAHLISAEKAKELGKHLLTLGNLVIGRRGEMGRCALVESDEQALCGTGCLKVVLDGTVLPKYIAAQLISQSVKEYLELNAVGTTLKNLNTNIVASTPIVIPPLPEQQFIADYLDAKTAQIDSIVFQTERSIDLLHEYRKSVISEAVTKGLDPDAPMRDSGVEWIGEIPAGWELCRLRYLSEIGTGDSDTQDADPEGEYPFFVRSPVVERSNSYSFEGEAILMAGDGAGAGRVFHHAFGKYAVHQRVYRIACNGRAQVRFLLYSLSSIFPLVMDMGSAQSTVPSVRKPMLDNLFIPTPRFSEQQAIADYLDAKTAEIDSLIADKQRQVELLREYRKSLISEAVAGKFKVPGLE